MPHLLCLRRTCQIAFCDVAFRKCWLRNSSTEPRAWTLTETRCSFWLYSFACWSGFSFTSLNYAKPENHKHARTHTCIRYTYGMNFNISCWQDWQQHWETLFSSRSGVCSPSFYGNNAFDRSKPLRESMPFVPALPSRCMTPSAFPTPKTLYMLPKWIACIAPCNPLQSIAVFVSGSDGSC